MRNPSLQVLGSIVFLTLSQVIAQNDDGPLTLSIAGCSKDPKATATYSKELNRPTGGVNAEIQFEGQAGAEYIISTDTKDIVFYGLGIPGTRSTGDTTPEAAEKAAKLDKSSKTITIQIPAETKAIGLGSKQYYFAAGDKKTAEEAKRPGKSRRSLSRRETIDRRQDKGRFKLKIVGKFACSKLPALGGGGPVTSPGGPANPQVEKSCKANKLSSEKDAWATYGVRDYLIGLFNRPNKSPGVPAGTTDVGDLLGDTVGNVESLCSISTFCQTPACGSINGGKIDNATAPLYLAYRGYTNFANWLHFLYEGVDQGITLAPSASVISQEFFSNDPPADATFAKVLGAIAPFLGIVSGGLGAFSAGGVASVGTGIGSGLFGSATNAFAAVGAVQGSNVEAVVDKKFAKAADIEGFTHDYALNTINSLETAFKKLIGGTKAEDWAGDDGIMADGAWLSPGYLTTTESVDFTSRMWKDYANIIGWRSINFAWASSDVFIIYVPYGRINDEHGSAIDFNRAACMMKCTDTKKCWCSADAGKGMGRLYRAKHEFLRSGNDSPGGLDSDLVLGDWKFHALDIIEGSIASYLEGDFNYRVEQDVDPKKLDAAAIRKLAAVKLKATAPGVFNLPVCRLYDLRSVPGIGADDTYTACGCKSATGAKDRSKKFDDFSSPNIRFAINQPTGGRGRLQTPCNVAKGFV